MASLGAFEVQRDDGCTKHTSHHKSQPDLPCRCFADLGFSQQGREADCHTNEIHHGCILRAVGENAKRLSRFA